MLFPAERVSGVSGGLQPTRRWSAAVILIPMLLALSLSSCTVKFVSDYDQKLDDAVTDLHTNVNTFLIREAEESGTLAGEYVNNKEFYASTEAAISSMRMRAESSPQNELTVKQIDSLEATLEDLQKLHQQEGKAGLRPALIPPIRDAFDRECAAITTFELAKKRGK